MNQTGDHLPYSVRKAFLLSRDGAILRCAEFMLDSGRKDLAKQILSTAQINREYLAKLKVQLLGI